MALRVDDVDLVRDRALVERFQEGDPAAFDTLYTRYFGRLVRFCQKRVGDPHEAEEIAQEAFTKALRALPTFEGERRFYPWMTVIAGRLCVDAHRRRGRTEPSSSVDLGVIDGGQERIVDLVDVEILRTAMGELAPRHREVLDLRELQGWSYQQIADHYGVTLGTVEALLFRARKALKREFMAVVGGDRNWAALPVLGGLLRRIAGWKARLEAAGSAAGLPALGGSAVAAAVIAITAVTGAVGAGMLQGGGSGDAAGSGVAQISSAGTAVADAASAPQGASAVMPDATPATPSADRRVEQPTGPDARPTSTPTEEDVLTKPTSAVYVDDAGHGRSENEGAPVFVDSDAVQAALQPDRVVQDLTDHAEAYLAEGTNR